MSLDGIFAAEGADVSSMLGDFHLLDLFSEGGTVASAIFAGHADLCGLLMEFSRVLGESSLLVRFVILASEWKKD